MAERRPARRFEDLVAWQKARLLTRAIYGVTAREPFVRDFGLRDQVRRASTSIMSNIAEGFERTTRSEFHQFLNVAKSSCAELRSHLYVALDVGYLEQASFDGLMREAEEGARITGGLRAAVGKQRNTVGIRHATVKGEAGRTRTPYGV